MNEINYDNLTEEEWKIKKEESWKKIEAAIRKREEEEAKKPAIIRWLRKVYRRIETNIEMLQVKYKMKTDGTFRAAVEALEAGTKEHKNK